MTELSPTTGVVTALEAEARTVGVRRGQVGNFSSVAGRLLVAVGGIGTTAAAVAATSLLNAGADRLVSWGMAGGLDPRLNPGTICLPTAIISRGEGSFAADEVWCSAVRAAVPAQSMVGGLLLTSHVAILDVAGKAAAFHATRAVAVDMESMAIARIAHQAGVPFIAIRSIVDRAADTVPAAVIEATACGQVRIARLLLAVLRSPLDVGPLLRLATQYRAATRALCEAARDGALGRFQ